MGEISKTTASLIEGTVKKVKDGEVLTQAHAAFLQSAGRAGKGLAGS